MKKTFFMSLLVSVACLSACSGGGTSGETQQSHTPTTSGEPISSSGGSIIDPTVYPDFPLTPGDKDSWEYLKDSSGKIEPWDVEWFVNDSTFAWNSYGSDRVSQIIKEKTGVNIKFTVPVTDDGQKLATLISGNKLPDLVSVQCWYPQCSQLANQGYLYPLDGLIERWAPSFKEKEQTDIWSYFTEGNGMCYGVPNFAYSTKYVKDSDKLEPNGCLMVRKDWYEEASSQGYSMTDTTSFINGCKYIASKHTNAIPFQLDAFTSEGNESLDWLAQYFCAAFEDGSGNYVDIRTSPRYLEMLQFLHECAKEKVIKPANFSDKAATIRTNISRGNVFVSAVTPQDYQMAFYNCYNSNIEYVPLILKNKDNQAPILQDISGNGYLLTMISKKAKRPDKVIKLLEYLYSEEGQRLVAFGVEGESYYWNDEHTEIHWTPRYISGVNGNLEDQAWVNSLGLYQMTLLMNLAYINKYKPLDGRKKGDEYIDNMKRPLTPYSYNFKPTFLKHDTADPDYFTISTKFSKIKTKWSEAVVNIIRSDDVVATYNNAIKYAEKQGLNEVNSFYSKSYLATKELLGVEWGYPANNPSYKEPEWKGPHGDFSYWRTSNGK